MKNKYFSLLLILSLAVAVSSHALGAEVPVALTVDTTKLGSSIPDDYAGLSYETKREMPDKEGKYYFRADNAPLIKMFQTLGIKNLRIGGNTVDSPKVTVPVQADIDNLFSFAKAADLKVIYSFRMRNGNAADSAQQAKYIFDNYASNLLCFSIGNEPDVFVHSYGEYLKTWKPIYEAVTAAVPQAKLIGPSLTSNGVSWAHDFARDYFPSGKFLYITQHEYAGGAGGKVTDPVAGRDMLLSPEWQQIYQKYYDKFIPLVQGKDIPYRLEEANNFYNGGAKDVSDTFASAIWGLDYLYWYASHGSQGINFHNGDEVAAGQNLTPCRYASFTSSPGGYFAHPLAYAIKVFNLGSKGQLVSTTQVPDDSGKDINIVSYAVLGADKNLYVTLLNKEHGANARDALVTIKAGAGGYTHGQSIALVSPGGDVAAKEGLTLGGNPIKDDGTWEEKWTDLPAPAAGGQVQVKVPAASILLVRLSGS